MFTKLQLEAHPYLAIACVLWLLWTPLLHVYAYSRREYTCP